MTLRVVCDGCTRLRSTLYRQCRDERVERGKVHLGRPWIAFAILAGEDSADCLFADSSTVLGQSDTHSRRALSYRV